MQIDIKTEAAAPPRRRKLRRKALLTGFVVILLLMAAIAWLSRQNDPVPGDVRQAVDFPVYYPDPSALPAGYHLAGNSFRTAPGGAVVFQVITGDGQRLSFSEQPAPDSGVIDKFISSYIPLHTPLATPVGQAEIGAAGSGSHIETVASLPVNHGPWLIMTGPANGNQPALQQVLKALKK